MVDVRAEMEEHEALALAQLLKRIGYQEIRANAVDDEEAETMIRAIYKAQKGLEEAGFSPR